MHSDHVEELRKVLESEQLRLSELLERTDKHLYHRQEPIPAGFSEQATETENDEVVEALDHNAKDELVQIRKAFARINSGHFGVCIECGSPIQIERLRAIPHTELCSIGMS